MELEEAVAADLPEIAALMNRAYRGGDGWASEAGYITGDRTNPDRLAIELAEAPDARLLVTRDPFGALAGCLWLQRLADGVWYVGSLAIPPEAQAEGAGRRLLAAAEARIRAAGGTTARITVVHVREALIAWYERRGYVRTGASEPWPYGDERFGVPLRDDLRFIVLEKALG